VTGFEQLEACAPFDALPEPVRMRAAQQGYKPGDGVLFNVPFSGDAVLRPKPQ
jgi:hypothetical protein